MFRKRHPPAGAQPGTLMINGVSQEPRIRVMRFTPEEVEEHDVADVDALGNELAQPGVIWVDVQGLGNEGVLRKVGETFGLHPLALEDAVNVPQRPKVEVFDAHTMVVMRAARVAGVPLVEDEQITIFVSERWVLAIQERHGDVFDPVRERIRRGGPVFRSSGAGYLAYALLDAGIDGYYPILEQFGEELEELEDAVLARPRAEHLRRIHRIKRELTLVRRASWALREVLNTIIRDELSPFGERLRVHLRDCYDHCVQIMDVVESYRELAGGLMDAYLSSVGNRQNEVMKTLTIMASIFIPLSFVAGLYGMNFEYMPELHVRWAYPAVLVVMGVVALGLLWYFWRRGWLTGDDRRPE